MSNKIKYIVFFLILISSIGFVGCKNKENIIIDSSDIVKTVPKEPIFSYSEISTDIKNKMLGSSMPKNEPISFDDLSYLKLTYYGFDEKTHIGEMIVNKDIAEEVVEIFKELYVEKYPIERIRLIDEYNASDELSMKDNNSSSFCYRTVSGTDVISNHGKGVAIDINPLYNPHVNTSTNKVSPDTAYDYVNRNTVVKGMIVKGDACYNAFIKRGWSWGGNWRNPDYQHFEKNK